MDRAIDYNVNVAKNRRPAEFQADESIDFGRNLLIAAFLVWFCLVTWHFHAAVPWLELWRAWIGSPWSLLPLNPTLLLHAKTAAIAAWLCLALLGTGRTALSAAKIVPSNHWDALAFSFAAGYGIAATALLLLGLVGLWRGPLFFILAAPASLAGAAALRSLVVDSREQSREAPAAPLLLAALGLVFLQTCRFALVPETFFDALTYHLALPNLYLSAGGLVPTPENSFSGIPSLPEMVNGLALAFEPFGTAANLIHLSMPFWTAAAFLGLARRLGRPEAGPWAAATYILTPVVSAELFRVSVGAEWALLQVCYVSCLFAALQTTDDSAARRRWLVLSGAFLGFCMGTKYPAFLVPFTLAAVTDFRRPPTTEGNALLRPREALLVYAVAAGCVLPWLAKNAAFYGNPVFPFFAGFFDAQSAADWRQIGTPTLDFGRFLTPHGAASYLAHPWRFVTSPEDIGASMGPQVLALLPAVLLARLSGLERRLAAVCLLAWIPLSVVSEVPRFFIPHIALAAFFLCVAVTSVEPAGVRQKLFKLYGAALSLMIFGLPLLTSLQRDRLAAYMGRLGFSEFLAHSRVSYSTPPYAAIEFINQQTPADSRVLLVGDSRSHYLKRRHIASGPDQHPALEVWANASADAAGLKAELTRRGVTHILVNKGEMSRTGLSFELTPRGKKNLESLMARHTERIFQAQDRDDRWLEVFRIRP